MASVGSRGDAVDQPEPCVLVPLGHVSTRSSVRLAYLVVLEERAAHARSLGHVDIGIEVKPGVAS